MSYFWSHFVPVADLGNPMVDLFHITQTHFLVGVYVPFGVYEICPT